MPKKKIEVVELNKKEEKIILEESESALLLFWRHYRGVIFSLLLVLSLIILGVSTQLFLKNINKNDPIVIKEVTIETSLKDYITDISGNNSLTDETAKNIFNNNNNSFKNKGEVLLVNKIEQSGFTIKFFSDGTALKISKDNSTVIRINSLENGNYGIGKDGIVSSNAYTSIVKITKTVDYPWGKVTYFSDGSAEVTNSKMDLFVRDSNDVLENYISNNKVTYLKESKNIGNIKLNYYYDGTIEVIKNNKSFVVRDEDDLNITNMNVTFKNNNQAEIYSTKKMDDGKIIDFYTDGGAIIRDGSRTLSVRKSNSIVIKNNKIFEIVDNIYVEVSKKTDNVTYYTNGGAVINKFNGETLYIPENSDIKYKNNPNNISNIDGKKEKLSKEKNIGSENVKNFENTAVVTTDKYIAIVEPIDSVIYDDLGKIKTSEENSDEKDPSKEFTITNNTNKTLKYRVVIEKSARTTLDVAYIRYQLSANDKYIGPAKLDNNIWKNDNVFKELNIKGTNYILIDSTIEPYDTDRIKLMLWTDYDTIPNSQMNKYFYGTIRLYAWTEE